MVGRAAGIIDGAIDGGVGCDGTPARGVARGAIGGTPAGRTGVIGALPAPDGRGGAAGRAPGIAEGTPAGRGGNAPGIAGVVAGRIGG